MQGSNELARVVLASPQRLPTHSKGKLWQLDHAQRHLQGGTQISPQQASDRSQAGKPTQGLASKLA